MHAHVHVHVLVHAHMHAHDGGHVAQSEPSNSAITSKLNDMMKHMTVKEDLKIIRHEMTTETKALIAHSI